MKLFKGLCSHIALRLLLASCFLVCGMHTLHAQLCTGSLGDPVVKITFGAGPNPGAPLSAATTNYQYVNFDCPNDGYYTVRNQTVNCFGTSWHTLNQDHTGDPNGYFMLVNASIQPNDFYVDTVTGLCPGTTFEFAAWITNMMLPPACGGNGIQPNITFSIETTAGVKLSSFNSGNIPSSASPLWQQYGLYFKTPDGVSDVVIRMTNNAPGGCGNDLALDDITFRPCGPLVNTAINGNNSDSVINICVGDTASVILSAQTSGGYTSPQYQWQLSTDNGASWNDIPGADSLTYKRLPTPAGKYLYRLAVAEQGNIGLSSCRVASKPLTVNVNILPTATVANDGPKCAGGSFTLTAGGGATYAWSGPGGFTAKTAVAKVANPPDAAKYFVKVTNSFGCSVIDSTVLMVYANPVGAFSTSLPSCENGTINFTNQSTVAAGENITQNAWLFGDGSNSAATNPSHVYTQAKTYNVSLITTTDKGCTDTIMQSLAVHYLPEPDFLLPKVCLTDPFASFTNTSQIQDSTEGGFTYLWNFGDANATAGNPNTSSQKDAKHSYTATGVYDVQLTVTSNNGCVKDTVKPFTVNGALPKASFTFNNGDSICSNTNLVITDNSTVNFGNITKIEVYWDYANDTLNKIIDDSTQQGKKYQTKYPDFDNPATKGFSIRYIASSGINCINELDTVVTVKASPILAFDTIGPVCEGVVPFNFTQAREMNAMGGTGVYSGNGIGAAGIFNPQQAGLGLDSILYTFTASNGCSAFAGQTVQVYAQPLVDAGPDRQLLQGGSLIIEATASGNNLSYLWTPNIAIDNNKTLMPSVSPSVDITYTLTVTSSDGCASSDSMFIKVLKTPQIPNAFSPNGDGINDRWIINYLDSYAGVTVQVFNRNGQLVFSSAGYNTPWDGTFNGTPLPVGTYYYIIDRKIAGAVKLKGWVAIIR